MLTLGSIDPENWREPLSVGEDQKSFVGDRVTLCYIDGDEAARQLYEKCGFTATGEVDEDEIIMRLTL